MTPVRISLPSLTQHRGSRAGLIGRWTTSTRSSSVGSIAPEDGSGRRVPPTRTSTIRNPIRISDRLDAAPDRQRMVFILREVEGLSTDEICKILEATFTNLDVILYRMRKSSARMPT